MDLSQSGECNLADYQIADPIGNNDLEYSGTPEVGEPDFWNFVDAMNDAYAAGSDDGTISGATAGLDVLAAYGFMPEANYYINWADGNQSSAGPNSFGMSPMNIWWYWPSLSFPSCAEKQARLNDLSKASRGAWWGAGLSGFGATLAALIPGGQYAAVGFGATAFGYTVVAADLGDKYNWLNDNVPCIPRIAG